MATTKPNLTDMLMEIKSDIKSQHEANNYINVPQQIKYETERFKRSLQNAVPEGQESIVIDNTENNSQAFYVVMFKLIDLTLATNPEIISIYKAVSTEFLNKYQVELLQKIILTIIVLMLFPNLRKSKINEAKEVISKFLESIDVRKYDV